MAGNKSGREVSLLEFDAEGAPVEEEKEGGGGGWRWRDEGAQYGPVAIIKLN